MKAFYLVCLLCFLLSACSSEPKEHDGDGAIEQATKEAADNIVESIEKPIDKARTAAALEEEHGKELKEQAE